MSQHQPQWTKNEIDFVENLIGEFPRIEIVKQLQAYQRKQKLFVRSFSGISNKLLQLGDKNTLQLDRLNKSQLAKLLGIKIERVQYWFKKGLNFTPGATPSSNTVVELKDFAIWAKANVRFLHSIDRDLLAYATGDEDLADRAAALRPYRCPVINITTGQRYAGVEKAAQSHYISPSALSIALKQGRKCGGFEWKYEVAA
jgi:hypothetical protein